jgi:hypothetical protein
MPNPKALVTLYIMLVVALATAQTLPITANIQPYGAPPYSPKAPGTTFNLYEWVVINGTVTPQADFFGNITVTVFDTATNLAVASCTATNIGLSKDVTYSLYNLLQGRCALTLNPSYTLGGLVRIRSDGLALNFTDVPLIGLNRYIINVTFASTAGSRVYGTRFSISNRIDMVVKAFGVSTINDGTTYPHNKNYDFRLVVNVTHPDGRPYYNNSITVYVNNMRKIARYWANRTGSATVASVTEHYSASINNASWVLTISGSEFGSAGSYKFMVNVSNVRVSVNSAPSRVRYNVSGVNTGRLNFTLAVSDRLTVEFINVTAVWPNYTSTPPSLRNKPTRVIYTSPTDFNGSRWTLGDAFLLYVSVKLANGTTLSPSSLTREFRDYVYPLIAGVANKTTARGNYVVVAVNATLPKSEWESYYKAAYSGVRVNATLEVNDGGGGNTGRLRLWFVVTNTTMASTPRIFFNASKAAVANGSRVNLGDVLALELTVETHGGRRLNFTNGFSIRVYNVTRLGLNEYTSLFSIRSINNIIYLVVKPSRDAWRITSANWRNFMNKTYLAVNVTEYGMSGRMNLTLWWPGYLGGGRYRSYNISVTAKLPSVSLTVNRTTVVYYGQGVALSILFQTYGGNATVAKNLTLYVYRIDTQRRPFGWSNASKPFIKGDTYLQAGNYTFKFNVNGSKIWIPGVWYINATVGDIFGNAGDLNNTQLFTIRPKIVHSLPASLRVVAGKTASISSSLAWGNTTLVGPDAKLNITIVYPTTDGLSNVTTRLGNIANSFTASIPAPNVPGSYRVVVNFEYMTFGKKLYDTWVINLTVYVSVNATISDMRSNPNLVAVAIGRSVPRGPVRGALVEDNLAAAALASVINTTNIFFDDELLDPNTLAYKTVAGSYRYFIAVGGPLVNLFSYKYNATLSSIVQTYKEFVAGEVVEVGFKIMLPSNITRVYLNLTDNKYRIVYANGTVKVAGDYGKTDFAFVATLYDASVSKYIFISFGLDWRGTVAAGRWIVANINNLDRLASGQLVLLQWTDDNDGIIEAGEVEPILSA